MHSTKPFVQNSLVLALRAALLALVALAIGSGCSAESTVDEPAGHLEHPYLFHLVQASLWNEALETDAVYYPPTYKQDTFTHATANPELLMNVANHFYQEVPGDWLCLQMTVDSLKAGGVEVVFEGTAPVGDKPANFEGTDDELFPHILGGIPPDTVLNVYPVERSADGRFLAVPGITDA